MLRLLRPLRSQQFGLIAVIFAIGLLLTIFADHHTDFATGGSVSNFLNPNTLMSVATDASFFAIMAVGMTLVIISGGIDLSIGSVYALAGISMGLALRTQPGAQGPGTVLLALAVCCGVGLVCGLLNGLAITGLKVHPFIITLGTMWIYRGIAFVVSKAQSISLPDALMEAIKANLGLGKGLYPVPMLVMLLVTVAGSIYLTRTRAGRHIFSVGGNPQASFYSGLRISPILIGVYAIAGLTAGIAAFVGGSFYGSTACGDATGYELYVIASAVVGGASLTGGKGSALGAMLGALLIVLLRQAILTLKFNQDYEMIIVGVALVVAVILDRATRRERAIG